MVMLQHTVSQNKIILFWFTVPCRIVLNLSLMEIKSEFLGQQACYLLAGQTTLHTTYVFIYGMA